MKIMIVDDANNFRERLAAVIQEISEDIIVLQKENAESALKSIHEFQPDFLILDINLPGLSGIDMLGIVRPIYKEITIAMLTNFTFERFKRECVELGANFFYDKTFDIEKIVFEIKKILENQLIKQI